ncbi:putative Malate dehydrogenase [Hypsibius exemplaris]|uniref:Malate dehydrogenase n=1 Tax=Hypsibius exemplaris TaxID=2072580 RepID=A0A1W0WP15_HYPEX|nr:putative Malate dehydrogenase [Hypsibius exemplaris]
MGTSSRLLVTRSAPTKACTEIVRRYASNLASQTRPAELEKSAIEPERVVVAMDEAKSFIERCVRKGGVNTSHAEQLADVLVTGDYRGHFSHGLNRIDMYLGDLKKNLTNLSGVPCILKETVSTALVDGNNLMGPVVGNFAMDLAIRKAKDTGIGWVAARGSNHYGIAGYYGLQAIRSGLIGFSFTNTSPLAVPTRAKQTALGTNAFCVMAPAANGDYFALDMATTTVAIGKVELAMRTGQQVPLTWGVDKNGKETSNPADIYHGGGLLPIAGGEASGGYKGYGLNVLVEIFCGILGDAAFGPLVRSWQNPSTEANLGQCFGAIDPGCFGNNFAERLSAFLNILRYLEAADPKKPVLVAGDPERQHMAKCEELGGIPYHVNQITHSNEVARSLGVAPLQTLSHHV